MHAPSPADHPHITRGALTLRDTQRIDVQTLFAFHREGAAMAMVHPRTEEAFKAHWETILANRALGHDDVLNKVILLGGVVVGSIGYFRPDGIDHVGYVIGRDFWGRGIATEALRLLLEMHPRRPLHAKAAATNAASAQVLLRNGFEYTGTKYDPGSERYIACDVMSFELK